MTDLPDFSLAGRKALVTGSSEGIGRSIALALAAAGAEVVVHGLDRAEEAEETLGRIAEIGARARWVGGDLADGGGRRLGERVRDECGAIDILVLNASCQREADLEAVGAEDVHIQMQVNFQASLELVQVLAPEMRRRRWGRILALGSVQQVRPHPRMLVYAASKAAQMNLVINLARQFAADGVTVNALSPGVIRTRRNTSALGVPAYAESVRAAIPAGTFGKPDDCAGAALLLCSEAGRYITGQNLSVDGGLGLP